MLIKIINTGNTTRRCDKKYIQQQYNFKNIHYLLDYKSNNIKIQ
jgi:hypothetical protein